MRVEATVEEAWETNPFCVVSSPPKTPVLDAVKRLDTARSPEWKTNPLKVEEAWEKRPPVNVEREATDNVEPSCAVPLAEKVDAVLREPEAKREEETVEEAEERKPPMSVESPLIARVEEPVMSLETLSPPEIKTLEAKVEEAEWKTLVKEESPETARELDAERAPWTWRELLKVEDDWVTRPPSELM